MKNCFHNIYKKNLFYKRSEFNRLIFNLLRSEFNLQSFLKDNRFFFKNFCFETGIKRSICNFFSLYRMNLKIKLNTGYISGLRKIS